MIYKATTKILEDKKEKTTTTICFVSPVALDSALNAIAADEHASKSDVIRWAIYDYIDKDPKRLEIFESFANSTGQSLQPFIE